jgi:CheY-like chemotaxis protein/two-component sensor histidine kinase
MKKILIIEDEKSIRSGIFDILMFEGFDVYEAENGIAGIQLVNEVMPDLVLCDIMMPKMDGHEVLRQLRSESKTKLIPFIFMTALADHADVRSGMDLGADDYLTKPFFREELLHAIQTRLQKSEAIHKQIEIMVDDLRKRVISHLPHELLTPLNGILGFTDLIIIGADTLPTHKLIEMAETMKGSGERLLSLIKRFILYIKLISEKDEQNIEEGSVNVYLTTTYISQKIANDYKRIKDLVIDLNTVAHCLINEQDFSIVLNEILDNAFKFSGPRNEVIVSAVSQDKYHGISIHNKGRFFPENSINELGAFIQFDRKKFEQQGVGLGLIISKLILDRYKGYFTIESSEDAGTTVTVYLPVDDTKSDQDVL